MYMYMIFFNGWLIYVLYYMRSDRLASQLASGYGWLSASQCT